VLLSLSLAVAFIPAACSADEYANSSRQFADSLGSVPDYKGPTVEKNSFGAWVVWFEPRAAGQTPPTNVVDMHFAPDFEPVAWIRAPKCGDFERQAAKAGDLVDMTDCAGWPQRGSAKGRFARAQYTVVVNGQRCDVAMEVGDPAAMPEVRARGASADWVVSFLLSNCGEV
jgi:hypothetical protein